MDTKVLEKLDIIQIPYEVYWKMVGDSISPHKKDDAIKKYGSFDEWINSIDSYKYSFLFDNRIGIKYSQEVAEQIGLQLGSHTDTHELITFVIIDKRKIIKYKLIYGI